MSLEELNTSRLLAHARKQAVQRNLDDILIADVDTHHYENECYDEFLPFIENEVLRQLVLAGRAKGRQTLMPSQVSFQDMGGRITRYPLRSSEKTENGKLPRHRARPSLDGRDERRLFLPVPDHAAGGRPASVDRDGDRAVLGLQPLAHREGAAGERTAGFYSMLCLPLSDPDEALRQVETFGDRKHVTGFLVTSARTMPVHHNSCMKVYRAIEERGLALAFHSAVNIGEPVFKSLNRFASVHALGFPFFNILHVTNWVTNGLGERFPKLPVIWIEGGLAWVPFLMQRLDHEFKLRVVGISAAEEEAVRLHARHVLRLAADGARGHERARMHLPHDQCRDAADVRLGLSALGLRPAVDGLGPAVPLREGQAQHPRRHRGAPVQAAAAQRQAEANLQRFGNLVA